VQDSEEIGAVFQPGVVLTLHLFSWERRTVSFGVSAEKNRRSGLKYAEYGIY
jgi:hypothetical protein